MNLKLPNHKIGAYFSRNAQKRGGSMILVQKHFDFKILNVCKELSLSNSFECCGIEIPQYKLIIVNIYRTPDSNVNLFLTKLQELLHQLNKNKFKHKIVLTGDWNIDILKINNTTKDLTDILKNFNLKMHINVPTRKKACLDQMASNIYRVKSNINVLGLSDHETAQTLSFKLNILTKEFTIEKIDYSKENIAKFISCISALSFIEVFNNDNANEAFNELHSLIELFSKLCFPKIFVKSRNKFKYQTWLSKGIKRACRKKRDLYIQYTRSKEKQRTLNKYTYKKYNKILKKCIHKAQKLENQKFINNASNKCKATWHIINDNLNNDATNNTIDVINNNDVLYSDPNVICELFNNYFIDMTNSKDNQLNSNQSINIPFCKNSIFLIPTNDTEISSIIMSLKNSNAVGYDGISTHIIKICAKYLSQPLAYVINLSMQQGYFPDDLKFCIVKPLFKKDDKTKIDNYRPITLISIFSKIYEKVIYKRIYNFVTSNNLLKDEQYGFRTGCSTTLACYNLMHLITKSINDKIPLIALFLDMSKAFDFVPHKRLLDKLERYGIRGNAQNWLRSYLSNRQQCTEITKVIESKSCTFRSKYRIIPCGVPQGSVLGPLLFLLFINDLPNIIQHKCFLFADDTTVVIKCDNLNSFNDDINKTIKSIIEWLNLNNLKVNINKTKCIQFSTYNARPVDVLVKYDNNIIEIVDKTIFLGFTLDKHCNWKAHIENICTRINRFVYALRRLSNISSIETAVSAYHGYVSSLLSYGTLLWGNSVDAKRAFIVQKKCIRAICRVHFLESCKPLFKKLQILPLPCLYIKQICIFVRQYPQYFVTRGEHKKKPTRHQGRLMIPYTRLKLFKNSPYCMAIKIYNKLPESFKTLPLPMFKRHVHNWLLTKCFYSIQEYLDAK
ncbi:hypothetical protein ABMA27_007827 [Loxostege sticticalis]|uniref:Reverse transcriptase domain-containing protein n=1 Tax=Loxostege sticticalis TaxID=481309 RepID=A0ABR3HD02_LOXSC